MSSMSLEKFRKVWSLLPEQERKLPIVVVNDEVITWEKAYEEIIIKKSELGKKIQKKMENLKLL